MNSGENLKQEKLALIVELNDLLRNRGEGGQVLLTHGVHSLDDELKRKVLHAVQTFNDFTKDNDPYGEHDFGMVEIEGSKYYWKIDYYDNNLQYHSPDKSDPNVTKRVLTIMLAEEY